MAMRMIRTLALGLAGSLLAVAPATAIGGAPPGDVAAPSSMLRADPAIWVTKSMHQYSSARIYLKKIHTCARIYFDASWRVRIGVDRSADEWGFEKPRFYDSLATVKTYESCKSGAAPKKASRAIIQTAVSATDYSVEICKWNPSISIGAGASGWDVALGVSPSCDKVDSGKRATRTHDQQPKTPKVEFFSSSQGKVATWPKLQTFHWLASDDSLKACFTTVMTVEIYNASGSGSATAAKRLTPQEFCLPVGHWAAGMLGH